MAAYYNEFDKPTAAWLRELIKAGLIADGDVDERSIKDVEATDLAGYRQCHFFAGIGGWSYALRLAAWPDDRPVWTGSCPCQPYSTAGKQLGDADERNLWPEFYRLIRECRPPVVFGEQVEGAIRHGWLDGVSSDLEREGYSVGAHVLGAHSVGAPHIRQRLYWVADLHANASQGNSRRLREAEAAIVRKGVEGCSDGPRISGRIPADRLANAPSERCGETRSAIHDPRSTEVPAGSRPVGGMEHATSDGRQQRRAESDGRGVTSGCGVDRLGDTNNAGPQGRNGDQLPERADEQTVRPRSAWADSRVILCRDGKYRRIPIEPALFPLAHGLSGRVGILRGAGNAIVPETAAEFIAAYLDVTEHTGEQAASSVA